MSEQKGTTQRYNTNVLVGINQRDTLQNIDVMMEFMQVTGEEPHAGNHMILAMVRDALGHELQRAGKHGPH